jgi:hypothetical protein
VTTTPPARSRSRWGSGSAPCAASAACPSTTSSGPRAASGAPLRWAPTSAASATSASPACRSWRSSTTCPCRCCSARPSTSAADDRPGGKLVLDLVALQAVPEADAVLRYLRSIILERGDYNGRVLSVRRDDLRAISSLLQTDEAATLERLTGWGALIEGAEESGNGTPPPAPATTVARSHVERRPYGFAQSSGTAVASDPVPLVVQKFGGTSVADPERIREVADHVARTVRRATRSWSSSPPWARRPTSCSDWPARCRPDPARPGDGHADHRRRAQGHRPAVHGPARPRRAAQSFTGSQAGFITDTTHTNAKILELRPERISDAIAEGVVPVIGGAQGVSIERDVTFLGRGGSDTTAVAIAHALGADSSASSTPTSPACTPPTPASRRRPGACRGSASTSCSR